MTLQKNGWSWETFDIHFTIIHKPQGVTSLGIPRWMVFFSSHRAVKVSRKHESFPTHPKKWQVQHTKSGGKIQMITSASDVVKIDKPLSFRSMPTPPPTSTVKDLPGLEAKNTCGFHQDFLHLYVGRLSFGKILGGIWRKLCGSHGTLLLLCFWCWSGHKVLIISFSRIEINYSFWLGKDSTQLVLVLGYENFLTGSRELNRCNFGGPIWL